PGGAVQHRLRSEISGSLFHTVSALRFQRAGQAGRTDHTAMKELALEALDAVARRGVTYADVRAIETREREIATKNGKIGHAGNAESAGIGIRVLAFGCWGFAATDDLTVAGVDRAASLALEIARAGTAAKKRDVALA